MSRWNDLYQTHGGENTGQVPQVEVLEADFLEKAKTVKPV